VGRCRRICLKKGALPPQLQVSPACVCGSRKQNTKEAGTTYSGMILIIHRPHQPSAVQSGLTSGVAYSDKYAKRVTVDKFDFEFFEGLKDQINKDHRLLQGFTKKHWKEVRKRLSNTKGTMDRFVVCQSSNSDDAVAKAVAAIESNEDANLEESLKDLKRPAKKMKHKDTNDKENEPQCKTFENNPDYIDLGDRRFPYQNHRNTNMYLMTWLEIPTRSTPK
jgi:hypothetical protein